MRTVMLVGRAGCGACHSAKRAIAPIMGLYPENVTAHFTWDRDVERINARKRIDRVPLFVVENGGEEEFRFSGWLSADEIEEIVTCDADTLSLEDIR